MHCCSLAAAISTPLQYYTIAVGKLNAPKMANFMEVDVFVLVACPENSLVDSQVLFTGCSPGHMTFSQSNH